MAQEKDKLAQYQINVTMGISGHGVIGQVSKCGQHYKVVTSR